MIFADRLAACWRASFALVFQAGTYIALLDVIAVLGLQHVVRNFRADFERALAYLFGKAFTPARSCRWPLGLKPLLETSHFQRKHLNHRRPRVLFTMLLLKHLLLLQG